MGKLVVQQFVSADGFAADTHNQFTLFDHMDGDSGDTADFNQSNRAWLDSVGAIVLGADTYRMFVEYWPTSASDGEIVAPRINELPKFVFSKSLGAAPWGDYPAATIESGDAVEAIRRLKIDIVGELILWGSLTLSEALFDAGLVDTVRLVVLPVAIGAGRDVFPPESGVIKLRLENAATFSSGLVELEYTVTS